MHLLQLCGLPFNDCNDNDSALDSEAQPLMPAQMPPIGCLDAQAKHGMEGILVPLSDKLHRTMELPSS